MKNVWKILALLALALLIGGCGSNPQFGYFNADRVYKESVAIKELETEANEKLRVLQQEGEEAVQQVTTDAEFERLQRSQMLKAESINRQYRGQIQFKINEVLAKLSEEKKLDVVFTHIPGQFKSVHYGGVDVTDDLIERLGKPAEPPKDAAKSDAAKQGK